MECIIPAGNFKVISKAIQAISKVSDELCFQTQQNHLSLIGINMSRTAVVTFNFFDVFFSTYTTKDSLLEEDGCTFKLNVKTVSGIFRANKEKRVELCKIDYRTGDVNVTITMKYKQDITMTHIIKLIECKHPNFKILEDENINQLNASSTFYNEILIMFQHNDEDISWNVNKNKAIARNYNEGAHNSLRTIRTQVALNPVEFTTYRVQEETEITFALRPFRAAINFAETLHLNVTIKFSIPGKPAILLLKTSTFEAEFILATLNSEGVAQSTITSVRNIESVEAEERLAAESVNWEDDFEVISKSPPESPQTKRAKIFSRCFEATIRESCLDLGEELAKNSDLESE